MAKARDSRMTKYKDLFSKIRQICMENERHTHERVTNLT